MDLNKVNDLEFEGAGVDMFAVKGYYGDEPLTDEQLDYINDSQFAHEYWYEREYGW